MESNNHEHVDRTTETLQTWQARTKLLEVTDIQMSKNENKCSENRERVPKVLELDV